MPFFKLDVDGLQRTIHLDGIGFSLCELSKDEYVYPVEGWHWFADEVDARIFFELPAAPI